MDHNFGPGDWEDPERRMLAPLSADRGYFRGLEDRTVDTLRQEGLLKPAISPLVRAGRWTAAAAALALAFLGGTEFERRRDPDVRGLAVPSAIETEDAPEIAVTLHLDLEPPFEESFSDADAHPKERISRALALQTE
jgi:hypothetical protein